ncbi:hypothetical protein K7X08_016551 [Anisodus acutangulus]|uniref:RING-type E3 ubiquitin transferase n=1 Tax=Anisodus acutangulus TaxID=402998 RepID=A0A9Q1LH78_9SOLA|nr:hypothetical protein K7X08_016551 [Anisodus acutangulus]
MPFAVAGSRFSSIAVASGFLRGNILPTSGLDDGTIQSYQKVVLGESRWLPGLNARTCPICLVEYIAGESIRLIPLCQHCFHAHCVDEWLKMKATCPVCRNSPPPWENQKLDQF